MDTLINDTLQHSRRSGNRNRSRFVAFGPGNGHYLINQLDKIQLYFASKFSFRLTGLKLWRNGEVSVNMHNDKSTCVILNIAVSKLQKRPQSSLQKGAKWHYFASIWREKRGVTGAGKSRAEITR